MSGRDDAARFLHGAPLARSVVVPGAVAGWLYDRGGLAAVREQCRGTHDELDAVLLAFAIVSDEFRRHANGSEPGTKPVPTAEPAPSSNEQVSTAVAADRLSISTRAVRKAAEQGRLTGRLVDGRWCIDVASIRAYRARAA